MGQHVKINYDPKVTFNPNPPKHRKEEVTPEPDVWDGVRDKS